MGPLRRRGRLTPRPAPTDAERREALAALDRFEEEADRKLTELWKDEVRRRDAAERRVAR